jgi:hypothetical protein
MKKFKFLPVVAIMLLAPVIDYAQSQKECYNTVSFCPTQKKMGFTRNMQSLSGAFEQGDTSIVQIIVYKNMEYRISICSPSNPELTGQFQFKIAEDITKGVWKESTKTVTDEDGKEKTETYRKRIYETTEVVRYDNSSDEMSQDFIFQSNQTRKLKVKVYVPESTGGDMSSGMSGSSYACVGLLVEHQPGVVSGFNR